MYDPAIEDVKESERYAARQASLLEYAKHVKEMHTATYPHHTGKYEGEAHREFVYALSMAHDAINDARMKAIRCAMEALEHECRQGSLPF